MSGPTESAWQPRPVRAVGRFGCWPPWRVVPTICCGYPAGTGPAGRCTRWCSTGPWSWSMLPAGRSARTRISSPCWSLRLALPLMRHPYNRPSLLGWRMLRSRRWPSAWWWLMRSPPGLRANARWSSRCPLESRDPRCARLLKGTGRADVAGPVDAADLDGGAGVGRVDHPVDPFGVPAEVDGDVVDRSGVAQVVGPVQQVAGLQLALGDVGTGQVLLA